MIHHVIREIDRGRPIIVQEVEIKPEDELEDLQVNRSQSSLNRLRDLGRYLNTLQKHTMYLSVWATRLLSS